MLKNMNKATRILPLAVLILPTIVSAQLGGTGILITRVGYLINQATFIVVAIALLVFFWGLVKFISKAGDEASHAEGRSLMIWGLVALFVMVSVWGIIAFIRSELGVLPGNSAPEIPTFPRGNP